MRGVRYAHKSPRRKKIVVFLKNILCHFHLVQALKMTKIIIFLTIIFICFVQNLESCEDLKIHQILPRKPKLFPVLSWVIFPNSPCGGSNSTTGTCLSRSTCNMFRGNNTGSSCANGYGICCTLLLRCGDVITRNNSYFVNAGYPNGNASSGRCAVTVEKINANIEQIRLDFEEFSLNGVTNRACEQDFFQIMGYDVNAVIPIFCGNNARQHAYVNVGTVRGPLTLLMSTSGVGNRRWRIRVTQLERNNPSLAPQGCLQYFTGTTGNFRSYNFDSEVVSGQSNYLSNLNYASCVRRESGFCGIQYTAPTVDSFSLAGPTQVSTDTACASSPDALYLGISRFCGGSLAPTPFSAISTVAGQFRTVFTTTGVLPAGTYRGYNLNYQQTPCT